MSGTDSGSPADSESESVSGLVCSVYHGYSESVIVPPFMIPVTFAEIAGRAVTVDILSG